MADKSILFSGPMVRALLAGTKTQTRRILKPQPELQGNGLYHVSGAGGGIVNVAESDIGATAVDYLRIGVGDWLWVRETWSARMVHGWTIADARSGMYQTELIYQADGDKSIDGWWPSIHMPREFSRLTLTVTEVRVEGLNECTADDALGEGVSSTSHWRPKDVEGKRFEDKWWDDFTFWSEYPQIAYRELWDTINGPGSWDANPWVAAYTFTVERRNIDQLASESNG
ncbi:hypothetical protein [Devosia chinhatensis]|uniref:Uncharacterized protein n=1 Tax=Devosia chinhatensis TaxID=429727 RepID=A0A0F5FKJ2_9HYPH|nr:hypothetical protein [Devosia chinhatensis]KKB09371.1 hypothetical protein VE26_05370 [Devosia chinhatensis]